MKNGRVVLDGTFDSLKDNEYLVKVLKIHKHNNETSNQQTNIQDADYSDSENQEKYEKQKKTEKEGKIISDEDEEKVLVKTKTFKTYFFVYFGGYKYILFSIIASLIILTA